MGVRRVLAGAVVVVLALGALVVPLAATATAATAVGGVWQGSGEATAGPALHTRVVADGASGPAIFAYDNLFDDSTPMTGASAQMRFEATQATSGTVHLDWAYTGLHAWSGVTVELVAFASNGETTQEVTLLAEGPTSCCVEPSNGFRYSGTVALDVVAGQPFGFRLGGSNTDYNSYLRGRLIVGAPGTVAEDTLVVDGYDAATTDGDWGLTEPFFATTRRYLTNEALFGAGGTVPTELEIGSGIPTASRTSLIGTDVFVTGWVPSASIDAGEKAALVEFVQRGGRLVATTDDTNHTMVDAFGLSQGDGSTGTSTFADPAHPIAAGPFGSDTSFAQYATVGHYPALGDHALALARNGAGQVTMAEIPRGTAGFGSGQAIFVADVDFFTDYGTGAADNEVLIKNLFAHLAPTPPPADIGEAGVLHAVPLGLHDGAERTGIVAWAKAPLGSSRTIELLQSSSCVDGVLGEPSVFHRYSLTFPDTGDPTLIYVDVAATKVPVSGFVGARLRDVETGAGATSPCIVAGPDNDAWTRALPIGLAGDGPAVTGGATSILDAPGDVRWFKFQIDPGARVEVNLAGLSEDYDMALFKDIGQAFTELATATPEDALNRLGAEFAPSAFSPSAFSPSAFSPSAFSPSAFSPSAFSPSAFSPSAFSPSAFSPSAFSPSAFSPSAFSPSAFSPSAFSPSAFSPSAFSPSAFSPSAFSPSAFSPSAFSPSAFSPSAFSPSAFSPSAFSAENYASAQIRSLLSVSAQPGLADESLVAQTWNNTGSFYVAITGKNGEFDPDTPVSLTVTMEGTECRGIVPIAGTVSAVAGGYESIVLLDRDRLGVAGHGEAGIALLEERLQAYAARPEVKGVVVDLGQFAHIQQLHQQADAQFQCPYAENLTAAAIKDVIDGYRDANPELAYITLVGDDTQIPFFRYPDTALLGPEQNYEPPVADQTQSQAALRLNHVLGQDEYGASRSISVAEGLFPLPDLAVGRLVETPAEMVTVLDAYLSTVDGVVAPQSTLATGYDFLVDAAEDVQANFVAGTNAVASVRNDTLITPANVSPDDPASWTADQWSAELLDEGEDLVFLAGHFSANNALAADFETSALATDLAASDVELTNSLVFSAGCHSGYNIPGTDVVEGLTEPLDWTQAFAQKGATLVAGTGYQYGDTDFVEYSERLYVGFSEELRRQTADGTVAVGDALAAAKRRYLSETPDLRGLHRKSVLISTVFGLPNLRIAMPGERLPATTSTAAVTPAAVVAGPGAQLGLQSAELDLSFTGLTSATVSMTNYEAPIEGSDPQAFQMVDATYLSGPDGVVSNPAEPVLPLIRTDVSAPGSSLRGVGFRGGAWSEAPVLALTGAPTTEIRGVHLGFASPVDFPMRLATPNYFGALTGSGGTSLHITPVQHRNEDPTQPTSIRRTFSDMDLRLFYSDNTSTYNGVNTPALSAPPTVSSVGSRVVGGDVEVSARVVGDPAAGIQAVWITHTDASQSSGVWQPLDLVQDPTDSTLWTGTLVGAASIPELVFDVHAANGVGLVSTDDDFGTHYSVATSTTAPVERVATTLSLGAPATQVFGSSPDATVTLASGGLPVAGATVGLAVGSKIQYVVTDSSGAATVALPSTTLPGSHAVVASFAGTDDLAPSTARSDLVVTRAPTSIALTAGPTTVTPDGPDPAVTATLTDGNGTPLVERSVYFILEQPAGTIVRTVGRTTDQTGRASLGPQPGLRGTHVVRAMFLGAIPTPSGATFTATDGRYVGSAAERSVAVTSPPTITGMTSPVGPQAVDTAVAVTVTATDPDLGDTLVTTIDWGDGATSSSTDADGDGVFQLSHVYAAAGLYTVTATTTDAFGDHDVRVADTWVVVYDPDGGFVTGGGHIWSPKGAMATNPDAEGRANFGFVSKYVKGMTVPSGDTTFQFKAGGLHFESTSYEWLVISGTKATYRGRGHINGTGDYDFTLTARDADTDRFRLQIWDRANGGGLVYDNGAIDGEEGSPLAGGSIKVHSG